MKAHIIENNLVVNTIEVESLDFLPNLVDGSMGGIGWTFTDGNLMPPDEPQIPEETLWKNLRDYKFRSIYRPWFNARDDSYFSNNG